MTRLAQLTLGAFGFRSISAECNPAWTYADFSKWNSIGMCDHNSDQSPIDIKMKQVVNASLGPLAPLDLVPGDAVSAKLTLNEHTWEVDFEDSATTITWGGRKFTLTQFHFHAPSEHTIDGQHFDMEMHNVFTHAETKQNLVVAAFMIDVGPGLAQKLWSQQTYFDNFWSHFPATDGSIPMQVPDPFSSLMDPSVDPNKDPRRAAYLHYTGSLTTPPCTNETIWILLQDPNRIHVSSEFVARYREGINAPVCTQLADIGRPYGVGESWNMSLGVNNREVQQLGSRTVTSYQPPPLPVVRPSLTWGQMTMIALALYGVLSSFQRCRDDKRRSSAREGQAPYILLA